MPRTKRPTRKQEKSFENSEALKKLDQIVQEQKNKMDAIAQMEIRNVELAFKMLLASISKDDLKKTLGQLKSELYFKEAQSRPTTRLSARSASQDDGYLTANSSHGSGEKVGKKVMAPPSVQRTTKRRSRSAENSARSVKTATYTQRSRSVYRTPAYSKNAANIYPAITPKVTPQTPLTVLRQPRQGEMVVSMSGSPVMVPTCYALQPEEKANCNILLQDGTMLSLQPKHLRQSQAYIPFALMDKNVINQLKILQDNLDKVVRLGEKSGLT